MTIEHFTFVPPFYASDLDEVARNIDSYMLMASKREVIPPNHKRDITPNGYNDVITLRTLPAKTHGVEDTIGVLEQRSRLGRLRVSEINERKSIALIVRPNRLDGNTGIRVDSLVRYTPSQGVQQVMDEDAAAGIPVEWPAEVVTSISTETTSAETNKF